jgi:hypothetical protein
MATAAIVIAAFAAVHVSRLSGRSDQASLPAG